MIRSVVVIAAEIKAEQMSSKAEEGAAVAARANSPPDYGGTAAATTDAEALGSGQPVPQYHSDVGNDGSC